MKTFLITAGIYVLISLLVKIKRIFTNKFPIKAEYGYEDLYLSSLIQVGIIFWILILLEYI